MKPLLHILAISTLLSPPCIAANHTLTVLPAFKGYGFVTLNHRQITGNTKIFGFLAAKHVRFNRLDVTGSATLNHANVQGPCSIVGTLTAGHTSFHTPIHVQGNHLALYDSKSHNISMSCDPGKDCNLVAARRESRLCGRSRLWILRSSLSSRSTQRTAA